MELWFSSGRSSVYQSAKGTYIFPSVPEGDDTYSRRRAYRELDILFERKVPARKFKETAIAEDEDE